MRATAGRRIVRSCPRRADPNPTRRRSRGGRARGRAALRERRAPGHHAAALRQGLLLPRRRRRDHPRSGDPRPHPGAGDPAGLDRRVDLPVPERPHPGDRPRRPGPQAVPLPRGAGTATRDDKFDRMLAFAGRCPGSGGRSTPTWRQPGLPREKVLAAVVRLLELTLIRVGNEEYARLNGTFGLTTLRDRHARFEGAAVRVRFNGKSGWHARGRAARPAPGRRRPPVPGPARPGAVPVRRRGGRGRGVGSDDVNAYIREASGGEFTAKDFRTWAGTVLAYRALRALQPGTASGRRRGPSWRRSGRPRSSWATRRPSPARATSTPPSSRPTSRGRSGARWWRRPRNRRRRRPARRRRKRRPFGRCCVNGWRTTRGRRAAAGGRDVGSRQGPLGPPARTQAADS